MSQDPNEFSASSTKLPHTLAQLSLSDSKKDNKILNKGISGRNSSKNSTVLIAKIYLGAQYIRALILTKNIENFHLFTMKYLNVKIL